MSMVFFEYPTKGGFAARKAAAAKVPHSHRVAYRLARRLRKRNILFECWEDTDKLVHFEIGRTRAVRIEAETGLIIHHVWDAQHDQAGRNRDHALWLQHAGAMRCKAGEIIQGAHVYVVMHRRDIIKSALGAIDMAAWCRRWRGH